MPMPMPMPIEDAAEPARRYPALHIVLVRPQPSPLTRLVPCRRLRKCNSEKAALAESQTAIEEQLEVLSEAYKQLEASNRKLQARPALPRSYANFQAPSQTRMSLTAC